MTSWPLYPTMHLTSRYHEHEHMGMANAGTQASLSLAGTLPQYDSLAAISVMTADLANC